MLPIRFGSLPRRLGLLPIRFGSLPRRLGFAADPLRLASEPPRLAADPLRLAADPLSLESDPPRHASEPLRHASEAHSHRADPPPSNLFRNGTDGSPHGSKEHRHGWSPGSPAVRSSYERRNTMKRPDTRATRQVTAQKMQDGIRKHFGKTKTISFGGETYTPAALSGLVPDGPRQGDGHRRGRRRLSRRRRRREEGPRRAAAGAARAHHVPLLELRGLG